MTFFLIVASVYFGMHALVWWRTVFQLTISGIPFFAGWAVMLILSATPFLAYTLPDGWPQPLVRGIWWAIYLWMGSVFYLFWIQLTGMILEGLARIFSLSGWVSFFRGPGMFITAVLITLLTVGFGVYSASQWRIHRVALASSHITRDFRLVMASDIHLGALTPMDWLDRLTRFISLQDADLVFFLGDQVNDHPQWLGPKAAIKRNIRSGLGVFGVLGNHEYYMGLSDSLRFHEQAGIRLLRNETLILPETGIQLVGIDDPAWAFTDRRFMLDQLDRLAPELRRDHFTILLTHRPWAWEERAVPLGIDLQLSGHTHGGQIFPFNFFVRLHYTHVSGLYRSGKSRLLVSNGAGTWGPPMRVGAPSEIVVIDLKKIGS